ncbi:MAG TPA: 16S rRNA (adenine(1518)-N(6)/adenine(1519)-N(6))-dimethyltransferase RsmA [Candidatus Binatia bacterium]|nr:16S rRNA (adenine(1518)-N(6)/adenine(1519)-N(6))-dimethyltransferase RsmA [Candidatus Binatia bacterium]
MGTVPGRAAVHGPKKRFGQHFLHDPGVIARIVRILAPRPGQPLVEIGPGLGALTVPVLEAAGALRAVELDRDVIPRLQQRCAGKGALDVLQADALKVDFRALAAGTKLRLFGNLPYNISTPLLFHLLDHSGAIEDMHFMLQKEVVDRMTAAPGSPDYGRLTVMLGARAQAEALFTVGAGAFSPPPKVESAMVRLRPRPASYAIPDFARFEEVVRRAFGQRRKTLANALKGVLDPESIRRAGVDPGVRAEELAPEQFAALAALSKAGVP